MASKITFSIGGIHPNDSKLARERAIEVLPLPEVVYVSMAQHLGAPAKPVVAVGDSVKTGRIHFRVCPQSCDRYRQVYRPAQGPCR